MKIKPTISILVLLITAFPMFGQNTIIGEWYSPVRNKFLKIIVSADSIRMTKQKFDLAEKSNYSPEGLFKIEKTIKDGNKISFIVSETVFIDGDLHRETSPETGEQTRYKIATFSLDTLNDKTGLAIFSLDAEYNDIESAEKFLKSVPDTFQSINLYDQQRISIEKKKKDIKLMSLDEIKSYMNEMIKFDNEINDNTQEKYKLNYIYNESISREILSNLGFNSFFTGSQLDAVFKKYSENEEVQKLISEGLGKKG